MSVAVATAGVEPDWLTAARAAQADHFAQHGLPTARLESWKYTSLRALEGRELHAAAADNVAALATEDLGEFAIPGEGFRLVLIDGRFEPRLSWLEGLPEGLTVTPMAAADEARLASFRGLLEHDFASGEEALAALAAATAHGLLIELEDDVVVERPLHLLSLSTSSDRPTLASSRILIRLGQRASLQMIEQIGSLGDSGALANMLTQVELAAGARLHQVRLQQCADTAYLVTRQEVRQSSESRFDYLGLDLGGRLVRHDIQCRLQAPAAHASLAGLYALDGRRHVDNHTRIDHEAPQTTSEEFFKGVVDGRARAVFNGKVVVHAGADGTDAAQTNNNLVLSPHAEVDTKPELEIYADDVKCSHGATVGQLDERQLYYLRTRGIPADEARLLLTYAFCREIIERLGSGSELVEHLTSLVVARLPRQEALEAIES